jgi:nucleoside-diphosphate-sugar epimerase
MITNLVIGSEGFIGKPFCKYLENLGEEVIPFDIKRNKKEDARTYKFNFKKFDRVYFLAWDVGGSKYLYQDKLQLTQLHWNLDLLTNVMNQIEKQKPKFLFVSSQLSEEETVYGTIKRLGEQWTHYLGGVCIRVWNAYGVLEPHDIKSHVISDFVYQAVKFGKIKMLTTGCEWRQFTHIDDLVKAFHLSLTSKRINRIIYDACSYEKVQVIEVARIVSDLSGAKIVMGKKRGSSPEALNKGRLPGWLPTITLREGITRMVIKAQELLKDHKLK